MARFEIEDRFGRKLGEWSSTPDVEYAEQDEHGQLSLGVPGEQRAIPGLAAPFELEETAPAVVVVSAPVILEGQEELT